MPTHTCINGLTIDYPEPAPEVAAFIERVKAAAADPKVSEEQMLLLTAGEENPILETSPIGKKNWVTRAVLDNPVYDVLQDLVEVKAVNLGLVDLEATAADYTVSVADAAEQLDRTPAAVRAAIAAGKLDGWMRNGQWYLRPESVAGYQPSNRGRSNLGRRDAPASDSPLLGGIVRARPGATAGGSMEIRVAGGELVKTGDGFRFPVGWTQAIVKTVATTARGKTLRLFVIEPAEGTESIRVGDLFVEGWFRIVEKLNNPKKAAAAWKAGV